MTEVKWKKVTIKVDMMVKKKMKMTVRIKVKISPFIPDWISGYVRRVDSFSWKKSDFISTTC